VVCWAGGVTMEEYAVILAQDRNGADAVQDESVAGEKQDMAEATLYTAVGRLRTCWTGRRLSSATMTEEAAKIAGRSRDVKRGRDRRHAPRVPGI
jgi:hypothetical protein